jgi:hypothetical protein
VELTTGLGEEHSLELSSAGAALILSQANMLANTLGVARYFDGDFQGAIEALTRETELGGTAHAKTWFPLAMSHYQFIEEDQARQWYARACSWLVANESDEVDRWFHSETARLLGED